MQNAKRYTFEEPLVCEMCGDNALSHKILGQRLNQSQGLSPKKKSGISVSIKKCNNCGLIYSYPLPIPFNIADHYGIPPNDYWTADYFKIDPGYLSTELAIVAKHLVSNSQRKALDIGAGIGKGMISMERAGFETYGLEPSGPFYEKAIEEMKINPSRLRLSNVEDAEYPDAFFDFITFGAVLEHFYHPAIAITKAIGWLKPNGIIQLEVPSSNWLIARMLNLFYRLRGTNYVTNLSPMHVPFHLYEFSLKSFELLGKQLGFSIVEHHYHVCKIYYLPKIFHPILRRIMTATNTGMQLTIYLKKQL